MGATTSTTTFGQMVAPPSRQGHAWQWPVVALSTMSGVMLLVGVIAVLNSKDRNAAQYAVSLGIAGAALLAIAIATTRTMQKAREFNTTVYPTLRDEWERQWVCYQCGSTFEPGP